MYIFVIAYILFTGTQLIRETVFRKGKEAKQIKPDKNDNGTTAINIIYIAVLVLLPLLLKFFDIGFIALPTYVAMIGLLIMLIGIIIHFVAIKTLGVFFTRTLKVTKRHAIIKSGIYGMIRHPGYLGTILIGIGFGISSSNIILFLTASVLLTFAYSRRIKYEEAMLSQAFGEEYMRYKNTTWALIPYIF